ncbi:MAG: hypothetical protein ACFFG0_53480 [Candidatus Thorarchaeota archaeon]
MSQAEEKISPGDTIAGDNKVLSIYIIIFIIVLSFTRIHFSFRTIRYEDIEMKIKGKFLLFAFLTFAIGGFLDSILPSNEIVFILGIFYLIG